MRRDRHLLFAMLVATAAPAPAMTVADFIAKGEAVRAKGMMAMFSPDAKLLVAEMKTLGPTWRAQAPAARPPVCPPAGKLGINVDEIAAMMKAVPPAERNQVSVRDAFVRALNERYRCR